MVDDLGELTTMDLVMRWHRPADCVASPCTFDVANLNEFVVRIRIKQISAAMPVAADPSDVVEGVGERLRSALSQED
ncbi:hypothetical protein DMX78_02115 [Cutibacterium acnes]|nr:hypothetical protein HMPREF9567_00462 [Cutibacterium acnes HL013PA1]EFS51750.1 hypothetical protein HMPREF9587_00424 [Cutibacterium acnes HL025PA1]EFS94559.1 hypothetical protein HMPREF9608_01634 [Cutibacterium acnes HL067PA1]EFT13294.1 hypothetical protein HMPREF9620_00675 [Cutibacterium acnes HL037PA1]EFT71554.1 hypothetical protein HMPREF9590_02251 [Cutibacterium acnes HL059PA2]EFT81913.1 hypothetical protein HMPREF9602_01057 [Cutibacterium acnes HL030PA2]OFL30850.1 hypothetical protein